MTKEEIIKYLKNNEFDFARAKAALIACDLVFKSYVDSDKTHGSFFSPVFVYISYKKLKAFCQITAKNIVYDLAKKIYFEYLKDPKSLDDKISSHLKLEREMDEIWKKYLEVKNENNKKESIKFFEKFEQISEKWWHYGAIGEDKGAVANEIMVSEFGKRHSLPISEANEIFNVLSHPEEQTVFNLERKSFIEICIGILNGKDVSEKIKIYIKTFFWFKTDFYEAKEITTESLFSEAEKEIKIKGKENLIKELEGIKKNFDKLHEEKQKIASEIKLTSEDRKDLKYAEKTIQWIDIRKVGMMKNFYYLFTIVKDLAEKNGLDYHSLSLYTIEELEKFIKSGEKVNGSVIKNRNDGVFIDWEKGKKRQDFYGKDADKLFETYSKFIHSGDIRGQVASRGEEKIFRGIVKIIYQPSEDKFNDGDILVTSMTRIEFVPLMRKARAIITDEGGIACHAAIVSRELGKPCVIGTKIATKVLKDGNEVEIDTGSGLVKIIKKS